VGVLAVQHDPGTGEARSSHAETLVLLANITHHGAMRRYEKKGPGQTREATIKSLKEVLAMGERLEAMLRNLGPEGATRAMTEAGGAMRQVIGVCKRDLEKLQKKP